MNTGLKSVRYVGSVVSQSANSGVLTFAFFIYSLNYFYSFIFFFIFIFFYKCVGLPRHAFLPPHMVCIFFCFYINSLFFLGGKFFLYINMEYTKWRNNSNRIKHKISKVKIFFILSFLYNDVSLKNNFFFYPYVLQNGYFNIVNRKYARDDLTPTHDRFS